MGFFPNCVGNFRSQTSNENRSLAILLHDFENAYNLFRGFSLAIDYFSRPLAYLPMEIHFGITDIFKGFYFDFQQCIVYGQISFLHIFQNLPDFIVHCAPLNPTTLHRNIF